MFLRPLPALLIALGGSALADPAALPDHTKTATPAAVPFGDAPAANAPARMCFGGIEDGKVVVPEGRVADAGVETTAGRCRIDGGSDARAPQSPRLAARRFSSLA